MSVTAPTGTPAPLKSMSSVAVMMLQQFILLTASGRGGLASICADHWAAQPEMPKQCHGSEVLSGNFFLRNRSVPSTSFLMKVKVVKCVNNLILITQGEFNVIPIIWILQKQFPLC